MDEIRGVFYIRLPELHCIHYYSGNFTHAHMRRIPVFAVVASERVSLR